MTTAAISATLRGVVAVRGQARQVEHQRVAGVQARPGAP